MRRCKQEQIVIDLDSFFRTTMDAWGAALDKELMADHPAVIAAMTGGKR